MIERLEFAAPFVYSPRGKTQTSIRSKELCARIKRADPVLIPQIAEHVLALVRAGQFGGFFGSDVTLVPVPGHAPLAPGATTLANRIALALHAKELAADVQHLVERVTPVPKSATAARGMRPTASTHYETLRAATSLVAPRRILLVDDVITRGATTIAVATRLVEQFPGV